MKLFVASYPVDFRKGPDGLLALVRDAGSDPFNVARSRLFPYLARYKSLVGGVVFLLMLAAAIIL